MKGFLDTRERKKRVLPPRRKGSIHGGKRAVDSSCDKCGLYRKVKHPKIPVCGNGKLKVMFAGQSPGKNEDIKGKNFVGASGDLMVDYLSPLDLDFRNDFWTINSFRCKPTAKNYLNYQKCCYSRFDRDVKKLKPWLIVALGKEAIQSVFGIFHPITVGQFQDCLIPHVGYNCWVYCTYHPAFVLRNEKDNGPLFRDAMTYVRQLIDDREDGLEFEWKRRTDWQLDNVETITDLDYAVEYLRELRTVEAFAWDYENFPLKPFFSSAKVLSVGFATDGDHGKCIPIDKTPVPKRSPYWSPRQRRILLQELKKTLETEGVLKIAHNLQHEMMWTKFLKIELAKPWTCTMIRQHLRWEKSGAGKSGWYGPKSLKFQMFSRRGLWPYDEHLKPLDMNFDLLPDKELFPYNSIDGKSTFWLYQEQESEGYGNIEFAEDIHIQRGCKAMVSMNWEGVDVNTTVAKEIGDGWGEEIESLGEQLISHEYAMSWKKVKKQELDLGSAKQVGELLFGIKKLPGGEKTGKSKQWATTDTVIIKLINRGYEWPKSWQRYKKLQKNKGTFVDGYIFGCVQDDGKLHPSVNLAGPETARSAYSDPNMQNFPIRGEIGKEVRKAIVAPRGWRLREYDFGQHEIRGAAMLSGDKLLIEHIKGGYDFHREYAAKLLEKVESKITKKERNDAGKNGFVFPKIYGSGWSNIYEELGVKGYRVNEKNVKKVYYEFEKTYHGLSEWQEELVKFCRVNGYVESPLGYRRHEPLRYTEIVNFPVQNIAFVLLLYGVSVAMDRIEQEDLRSRGIFQVHDSGVFKHPVGEEDKLDEIVVESCTDFPWDFTKAVPLELGAKGGGNWLDMKDVKLLGG